MIKSIKNRIVNLKHSLLDAMKVMDSQKVKTLFVIDNEQFEGLITIGDIQRAIINNISLQE